MNGKSKVVLLILTMVLTVVLLMYMTYAWFDMVKETNPIIIQTGTLRLESSLYYAYDSNDNGTIEESEYEEVLEGGLEFTRIIPGEKYYFRIYTKNIGTIPGYLSISINDLSATKESLLQGFCVVFQDPKSVDEITVISLHDHNNYKIQLFENVKLVKNEFFTFDFTLEATELITSQVKGETLTITNFLIRLDQNPQNNHP